VLAADIDDGITAYQPSVVELAKLLGVSIPMVWKAKKLSPLARQAIMSGGAVVGDYDKLAAARTLLKVIDHAKNDDEALRAIIHRRGVNHVVDIAAAVEAASSQTTRNGSAPSDAQMLRRRRQPKGNDHAQEDHFQAEQYSECAHGGSAQHL
jgi:hypothetical protein